MEGWRREKKREGRRERERERDAMLALKIEGGGAMSQGIHVDSRS